MGIKSNKSGFKKAENIKSYLLQGQLCRSSEEFPWAKHSMRKVLAGCTS